MESGPAGFGDNVSDADAVDLERPRWSVTSGVVYGPDTCDKTLEQQALTRVGASVQPRRMTVSLLQGSLPSEFDIEWRGVFENAEVNALHAICFRHEISASDWWLRVNRFSLGWVCIRQARKLVGFLNVAWDGETHAFILDTMVTPVFQRRGVARALIIEAVDRAKQAGCEWLHVDFEPHLKAFYFDACGFKPTPAGLIALR